MPRTAIAVPAGLLGFVLYVGAVVALADHVLALHWTLQAAYFLVVGVAWTLPALRLIQWAAAQGGGGGRGAEG